MPTKSKGLRRSTKTHDREKVLPKILEHIASKGTILLACDAAGVCYDSFRRWRKEDPEIEKAVVEAIDRHREVLEAEVLRRGVEGWEEPVFYQGIECGRVRKYSDNLLLAKCKAKIPSYRDKVDVGVEVKGQVLIVPALALNTSSFDEIVQSQELQCPEVPSQ